jgi:hypothetical protein
LKPLKIPQQSPQQKSVEFVSVSLPSEWASTRMSALGQQQSFVSLTPQRLITAVRYRQLLTDSLGTREVQRRTIRQCI